eukprot:3587598-Rhodomonas_salina.4
MMMMKAFKRGSSHWHQTVWGAFYSGFSPNTWGTTGRSRSLTRLKDCAEASVVIIKRRKRELFLGGRGVAQQNAVSSPIIIKTPPSLGQKEQFVPETWGGFNGDNGTHKCGY